MKRIYALALSLAVLTSVQAQDVILTVAPGTSQVKATIPAGEYIVNEETVTSTGEAMSFAVVGDQVTFKLAGTGYMTEFAAVNQEAIIGANLSGARGMVRLDLHGNAISTFTMAPSISNGVIKELNLSDNSIASFNFNATRWNSVEVFDISGNQFSTINLTKMVKLRQLYVSDNKLTAVNISSCPELTTLWCDGNNIKSLDLNGCTKLESVLADNNAITKLTSPSAGLENLVDLWLSENNLETAKVVGSTKLNTLNVANNNLTVVELPATEKKMLFADFTGNRLTFSSLYSPSDITNYLYGNQQKFSFAKGVYVHGETIDMPEIGATNLSGSKITLGTNWYNWETDAKLTKGTKTGTTGDFYALSANKQYVFKPNFRGLTYATITTSSMPDLVMRSHGIRIISEDEVDGVQKLQDAGFTFDVVPGALRMSSEQPIKVKVVDVKGRIVWQGSVDSHGIQVDGLNGTYVVNGLKIAI